MPRRVEVARMLVNLIHLYSMRDSAVFLRSKLEKNQVHTLQARFCCLFLQIEGTLTGHLCSRGFYFIRNSLSFCPETASQELVAFNRTHSFFHCHVAFKLCALNIFKAVGHLRHTSDINNREEHETYFCSLQEAATTLVENKNVAHITECTWTRHFQYGDVPLAGRRDGGARQSNVAKDLGPLLRNCRSRYRPIHLQALNIERNISAKQSHDKTVHIISSSSSSASHSEEAGENKITRSGVAT